MSLLINLLPDLRQAKLRERRRRQFATGLALAIWMICGGLIVVLSLYAGGQKVIKTKYESDITNKEGQLRAIDGLVDALTAQQHLSSLPTLYAKRVFLTKFFDAYSQANPTDVTLTSMTVDSQNAMVVNGTGRTFAAVAKLARTLETSNVKVGTGASESNQPYFSAVTITSVSNTTGKGVSFSITANLASGVLSDGKN